MHFAQTLKRADGSPIEFTFSKGHTVYGSRYIVEVKQANKNLFSFKMKKDNNKWIIIGSSSLPEWIWQLEKDLSDAITSRGK